MVLISVKSIPNVCVCVFVCDYEVCLGMISVRSGTLLQTFSPHPVFLTMWSSVTVIINHPLTMEAVIKQRYQTLNTHNTGSLLLF